MEMHSKVSLYEIHGIVVRRRGRSRPIVRRLIARILAFVTIVKRAIEAELAARRAAAELADLDDRMLRDLGLSRSEIEPGCAGLGSSGGALPPFTTPVEPTISSSIVCLKTICRGIGPNAVLRMNGRLAPEAAVHPG